MTSNLIRFLCYLKAIPTLPAVQSLESSTGPADIAAELDRLHRLARESYRAKDVSAYMSLFAPDLRYKQADGRTIGRDQLSKDVATQLAVVEAVDTSYTRESIQPDADRVIELLVQTASVTTRHLFIFRRVWRVRRRGSYTWVRLPDGWRIQEVEVIDETITGF